jgi:two-component SAPR family response regulator
MLFSDVVMPGGMNGVQLSVEAKRLRPELKVLLSSGYTGAALGSAGLPADMPILNKPYGREDLAKKLRMVLSRE